MAQKTRQPPFDAQADIGTDYALIAGGIAAALTALIYLLFM
jgi:hypothetical protein